MTAGIALVADLQDLLSSLASDEEPGFAAGVYADGELVTAAAAGLAVAEHQVPVTEHTAFEIASVSKHLTSVCVLLLVRDGLVALDEDVRAAFPELALEQPVTWRQCLTHTGGLRDYLELAEVAGVPVLGISEAKAMDLIAGQRETDFPPGSAFSYSNTGYVLAGAAVRRTTGQSLAAFARERVFCPLGMTVTGFRDDTGILVPRLANGYLARAQGGFRRNDVNETVVGDGGCITTLADFAGWHGFMASGAALGTDIRDGLFDIQVLTGGAPTGYGLGLAAVAIGGEPAWWHSGSWAGYRTAVIYLPDRGAGVTVLANRNDRYASHIATAAATALVTGSDVRDCYAEATGIPAPAADAIRAANEAAGLWHAPALDLFEEFTAADGQLRARGEDGEQAFVLGTDGRWHGTGTASGSTYTIRGDALAAGWGLSPGLEDRYVRADPGSVGQSWAGQSWPSLPSGFFANNELSVHAHAEVGGAGAGVSAAADAAAEITIGLAAPRRLVPAGPGFWRAASGGQLTVRLADEGDGLLISVPGAHRLRFSRAASPGEGAIPRGVRMRG
jgi:CubicO group peptidase (beta-lactamase class C family)